MSDQEAEIREALERGGGIEPRSVRWLLTELDTAREALKQAQKLPPLIDALEAELAVARERDERLIRQMDECLNDDEAWSGERLVALIEDVRAALDASEGQGKVGTP